MLRSCGLSELPTNASITISLSGLPVANLPAKATFDESTKLLISWTETKETEEAE